MIVQYSEKENSHNFPLFVWLIERNYSSEIVMPTNKPFSALNIQSVLDFFFQFFQMEKHGKQKKKKEEENCLGKAVEKHVN